MIILITISSLLHVLACFYDICYWLVKKEINHNVVIFYSHGQKIIPCMSCSPCFFFNDNTNATCSFFVFIFLCTLCADVSATAPVIVMFPFTSIQESQDQILAVLSLNLLLTFQFQRASPFTSTQVFILNLDG